LLGIFLGSFGVHNFYLGYIKKAVIQLVISLIATAGYMVIIFAQMFSQFSNMMNNSNTYDGYNSYSMLPTHHLGSTAGSIIFMVLFLLIMLGIRVWTIIESVFILTGKINKDAKGNLLKD
jgi:TM2 domain-containing membrane protein YozV